MWLPGQDDRRGVGASEVGIGKRVGGMSKVQQSLESQVFATQNPLVCSNFTGYISTFYNEDAGLTSVDFGTILTPTLWCCESLTI